MGRHKLEDPRIPLPFRMKTSIIRKAILLGRNRLEAMIGRAKTTDNKPNTK